MPGLASVSPCSRAPIPATAGIGLKAQHYPELLQQQSALGWLEIHSENYLGEGGPPLRWLTALREHFPVSMHGVGLSLGSAGDLDDHHLRRLAGLARRIEPAFVSEHLAWSTARGDYLNDLIALPYTEESLDIFSAHVDQMQHAMDRQVLIENPSAYMRYEHTTLDEVSFLLEVTRRTGCGILLDVNNIYVSAHNLGFDAQSYVDAIPEGLVGEIHLGGHFDADVDGCILKIDDHGSRVREEVWALYRRAIQRLGPIPTLIEWDSEVPELAVLLDEAARADRVLQGAAQTRPTIPEAAYG